MERSEKQLPVIDGAQQRKQTEWEQKLAQRKREIHRKLLILSGKGGVGKSTVAVNLAVALARQGKRVGLLDIDVHGPSVPRLVGLEGQTVRAVGQQMIPAQVDERLKVMSIGFLVPTSGDAVIWRGPMKHGVIRQFLTEVQWGELDYLVVDSPPGTGDEPLSIAQLLAPEAEAIVVTTPQDVAVADVRRCITFCRTVGIRLLGVVENMSGLVCPKCGASIDLFKRGGGAALAREMNAPFLGQIPLDPDVVMATDSGRAILDSAPRSTAADAFSKIVRGILDAECG
ncbi:MAG TPA: ATP-binding protein [Planctomycetaceae bacterium]|nr:ATP-binding protein [Planctomycetaceae bacterium]HIQ21651.1 ATP-binding protein [Planctomycetota bacterium]